MATALYNPKAEITAMGEAQKKAAQIGLQTAQQKSLEELAKTKAEIAPEYLKKRATVDIGSQVAAKNFAEFLAQRGQNTPTGISGTGAQAALTSGAVRQGGLSNLAAGEAAANVENLRNVGQTNIAYQQGLQQSNAAIGATTMGQLIAAQQAFNTQKIAQENADRIFAAQQAQQKLDNAYRAQQAAAAASRSSGGGGGGGGTAKAAKPINTTAASNKLLLAMNDIVKSREGNFDDRKRMIDSLASSVSNQSGTQSDYVQQAAKKAKADIEAQKKQFVTVDRYAGYGDYLASGRR